MTSLPYFLSGQRAAVRSCPPQISLYLLVFFHSVNCLLASSAILSIPDALSFSNAPLINASKSGIEPVFRTGSISSSTALTCAISVFTGFELNVNPRVDDYFAFLFTSCISFKASRLFQGESH